MTAPIESATISAQEAPVESEQAPKPYVERRPGEPEAIFVVGVPRSGTTLMRAMLDTSDRIAIARENHYMGHVFGRRGARHFFRAAGTDLNDDETVKRIVDFIYSGEYERVAGWRPPSPHWYWLTENVDRDSLEQRLLREERTERGMFRGLISAYAAKKGKPGTKEFRAAVRDALETANVVATHGVFVMSPNDHNGLDNRARVMVRIDDGKWVLAK